MQNYGRASLGFGVFRSVRPALATAVATEKFNKRRPENVVTRYQRLLDSMFRSLARAERRLLGGHRPRQRPRKAVFLCGALCKSTQRRCQLNALDNGMCRFHGGLSTGPKTPKGRARALANLVQYRRRSPADGSSG